MKAKITVSFLTVFAFSAYLYPQSVYSVNEDASSGKVNTSYVNRVDDLSKSTGIPEEPASYFAGEYYEESFEGESFPPLGWQAIDISGNNEKWIKDAAAAEGSHSACIYSDKYHSPWNGGTGIDWLITPQLTIADGDTVRFKHFSYYSYGSSAIAVLVSQEETFDADSASLESAFTDTLLILDNSTSPNQIFTEYYASLSKYAGGKIYIAFKAYNDGSARSCIDLFRVGKKPLKDVEAFYINLEKYYRAGDYIYQTGGYKNIGTEAIQNVETKFEILETGKQSTYTITEITPGNSFYVSVQGWQTTAADVGSYTAKISAFNADDNNHGNDTLSKKFFIVPSDDGAKWFSETPMPAAFKFLAAASYIKGSGSEEIPDTSFIFTVGGINNDSTYAKIYKYNTLTRVWTEAGVLPMPLSNAKALTVQNKIYILPGMYRTTTGYGYIKDSLYIFDPATNAVTKGANCPKSIMSYAAGVYGDSLIYIIGGGDFMNSFNSVYAYNVNTNSWSEASQLPGDARTSLAGTICGDKIVVAGGKTSIGTVSTVDIGIIDPADPYVISWHTEEYPGGSRKDISAGYYSGIDKKYILFTGGSDNNGNIVTKSTWAYDAENETWIGLPYKLTEAYGASEMVQVVRNDSVYMAVLGGVNTSSSFLSNNEWLYLGPSDAGLMKPDVAALPADLDTAFVNAAIIPKAAVVNKRLNASGAFDVTMVITPGDYSSTKTVSSLDPKTSKQITFNPWTPSAEGEYTVKVYTSLNGDVDKTNDTVTSSAIAIAADVSVERLYISKAVRVNEEVLPKVEVYNVKQIPQTFTVTLKINPGNYSCEKTITALPGWGYDLVEFDAWSPAELGEYDVTVYSTLLTDVNNSNDTISTAVAALKVLETGEWLADEGPFNSLDAPSVYYTKKTANETEPDSGFIFIVKSRSMGMKKAAIKDRDSSFIYNIYSNEWTEAPTLPASLEYFTPAYAGGKIYVPGGFYETMDDYGTSDQLYIYDVDSNKWTLGIPMPKPAGYYSIGVYGDSLIYVIGGAYNGVDTVKIYKGVQIYNVKDKTWHEGTEYTEDFPVDMSGTIIKNKIVFTGGLIVEFKDRRTTVKDGSSGDAVAKMGELTDQVYIGEINPADPYSITWTTKTNPAGESYGAASSAYETKEGGYVLFAGGESYTFEYMPGALAYDPFKDEWTMAPDLQIPVESGCGVTAVRNDSVYFAVIGGYNYDYEDGLIQWIYLGDAGQDSIGVIDNKNTPLTYSLSQNYPNPFNPSTVIKYSIAEAGQVELKIYNILGQEVITLVNEFMNAGQHEVKFNAAGLNLSSGVYLYRIKSGNFVQTKKLMLIK